MASLIDLVRSRFLDAIRSVNPPGKWKILVVDEHSRKLLSATLKQYDILQENVTLIEAITASRTPQTQEAIYLLMPTSQNVDRIISDFSGGRKQYAAAHLFFIQGLEEKLFQKLSSSAAEPHLKGLQDLYINFWPIESRVFSLQNPSTFFQFYSPPRNSASVKHARARLQEELRFISKSILDVCVSLGECPYVRYYLPSHRSPLGPLAVTQAPKAPETNTRWRTNLARGLESRTEEEAANSHLTKLLAFMVQRDLDEYKKLNPDFGTDPSRPRAVLFITDRSLDLLAPFVHEFTYQAMCNDLLTIVDGSKYTYKFQSSVGAYEDKVAVLSDADSVWTEIRHMHMREAIDKLMADFNAFLQENAGFKGEGAATLNDMKDMLANLPQYQEQREKFSLHLNMAQECMDIFERNNLAALAAIEQNCATGLTSDGKTPKTLVEEMVPLLDNKDISNSNKARIIALYIQYRDGVPDEDRRRLYQHARLPVADQDAINGLAHMGVRLTRNPTDRDPKKRSRDKGQAIDDDYELSRFRPALKSILEEHCSGKLDKETFPFVREPPTSNTPAAARLATPTTTSLRSAKPSWHRPARSGPTTEIKQRLIVFVAGGMTYSESRTISQLSASLGKDIFIGSTHTVSPKQFLDDLRVLDLGGVGSRALPNGLNSEGGEEPREYQSCYDQRYFINAPVHGVREQAVPAQSDRASKPRPLPTSSGQSPAHSTTSLHTGSVGNREDDKKKEKKRNFFHF
ncbi:Sec1-like snare protein [Sistotremastrum niveocremeum HHB9708]|uniref:Sec1-like snare protein n=2 Tax=Sistotremastraceae TaxID=3402574 RepID=A0A164W1B5_9AGAM|nr:Sec1-like snare protein [Sistotremastrum niveocremeum HHB9708]KZT37721.1 Sec1-like protein [Sistotremastrum suecicum HHB10207 ss-3]